MATCEAGRAALQPTRRYASTHAYSSTSVRPHACNRGTRPPSSWGRGPVVSRLRTAQTGSSSLLRHRRDGDLLKTPIGFAGRGKVHLAGEGSARRGLARRRRRVLIGRRARRGTMQKAARALMAAMAAAAVAAVAAVAVWRRRRGGGTPEHIEHEHNTNMSMSGSTVAATRGCCAHVRSGRRRQRHVPAAARRSSLRAAYAAARAHNDGRHRQAAVMAMTCRGAVDDRQADGRGVALRRGNGRGASARARRKDRDRREEPPRIRPMASRGRRCSRTN